MTTSGDSSNQSGAQGDLPIWAGGKGWLWGLGGIVVASVVWGGAVLAFGGTGGVAPGEPDLRGYTYSGDYCEVVDTAPFTESGYRISRTNASGHGEYPDFQGTEHAAVDSMFCLQRFLPSGAAEDDHRDAHLHSSVTIHKKTDPGPEFTAGFDTWTGTYGRIEEISGLGDEAYMTIERSGPDDPSPAVTILARDGWVVASFTWSQYVSRSSSSKSSAQVLSESDIVDKLTLSAESTLAALRD
ncbi:hypothetical protein ACFXK0_25850 [Nocardia sp. NPDC059177]|uniref:hypothetical protein n=1 Tax=Nocardia sp. NPDC059177 TaxID=3346759 RepID=UPI0036AB177C